MCNCFTAESHSETWITFIHVFLNVTSKNVKSHVFWIFKNNAKTYSRMTCLNAAVVWHIADFTPSERVAEVKPPRKPRFIPPYNGFGSEEDSLGNCLTLIPKPPQRDFVKFMAHDRRGLDSNEVRFTARLVTDVPVDKDRRFQISYFRTDDTMQVFEPPVRNSGIQYRYMVLRSTSVV